MARLSLANSHRVLEVGPGSGFFSAALARRVPDGRLELLDLQAEMLAKARRKLSARGFRNVGYVVGDAGSDLPFLDDSFDRAVLVSVLGEVRDQAACLASLYRVLRPRGLLAFHESIPDPDRVPFEKLRELVEAEGFETRERWGYSWNYTAVFVKPAVFPTH